MFTGCVEAGVKTFLVDDGQDCSSWLSLASANLYYGSADGGKLYDEEASSFGRTEVGEFVRVSDGDEFQDLEQKCVSTMCMQPTAEDDLRNCEGVGLVQVISPCQYVCLLQRAMLPQPYDHRVNMLSMLVANTGSQPWRAEASPAPSS